MLAALAAALAASPASAQTADLTADLPGGGRSSPPDYAFDDGTVVIGGDSTTDCPSFATFLEQGYFESGDTSPGAQRVLDKCEEAGLLQPGGDTPSASASASTSPGASAAGGGDGGLPETGGPGLPALLAVLGVLMVAGGLLARNIARE